MQILNTETSIATEKIFYVPAAAPCVVATDVAIISAKDWPSPLVLATMSTSEGLGGDSVLVNA